MAAPFLILACAPRWELAATAACWCVLLVPGLLTLNYLLPRGHPLQRGPARFAMASVMGLALFGAISWPACLLHLRLTTVLGIYAVAYVMLVVGLARAVVRQGGTTANHPILKWLGGVPGPDGAALQRTWPPDESSGATVAGSLSRGRSLVVIGGIALMLIAAWWATSESLSETPGGRKVAIRANWAIGSIIAACGATVAGIGVCLGRRRASEAAGATPRKADRHAETGSDPALPRTADDPGSWLAASLWVLALGLTLYVMKASYALPQEGFRRDAWNSDDVVYVAEAVDYRYGAPLGRFEPTLGAGLPMSPVNLSPLIAPLVAAISAVTGVECAALHHSVLCPLIVLLGASAMAGALGVVFRGSRWAVPLGLIAVMMVVCKSWDYERSMVEFTVWRAMQSKSVHLWLIHPLQLATLILLAIQPSGRHLGLAAAVAAVGHLIHPFSTILGAVWSATAAGVEAIRWIIRAIGKGSGEARSRPAFGMVVALTSVYALLGGAYKVQGRLLLPKDLDPAAWPSSGRVEDEPEESRDLVRGQGGPIPRQDPRILFGYDAVFSLGAVALPLVLGIGLRRREWLYVGVLGGAAVALCNSAELGRFVGLALPAPILWRARWMLPALVCVACVSAALFEAVRALLPRGRAGSGAGSVVAATAVCGAFAAFLAGTESRLVKIGPAPKHLTKFSDDMHGVVELLGGARAAPFVWGTREVTRELPQLMPNLRLVLSREKIMLPANDPEFREKVLGTRESFRQYRLTRGEFQSLLRLYPVDHVVTETSSRRPDPAIGLLLEAGWSEIGNSGRYRVWRKGNAP